jgi:bifunctional non-homologous end joining protein LigD
VKSARAGANTGAAPASVAEGDLEQYRKKRDFERTPEPAPSEASKPGEGFSFVVQKHAARRLHYDFRLELNGVLKSWAVTKGPSLDPADKRLAVHVEDHPLEYGSFEGVIPRGQYGGGTVMIWDQGRWEPEGDPEKSYAKGKLTFRLFGERLKGRWTLARMGGRAAREEGYKNWLLIKSHDEWARPGEGDLLVEDDNVRSVTSGRTMAEIAEAVDRVWTSEGEVSPSDVAKQAGSVQVRKPPTWPFEIASLGAAAPELPEFIPPELATLADKPPAGQDWVHEIKFDGYRTQCRIENGRAVMRTRTGLDWTDRFRHLAGAAERLPVSNAILDGEIVALEPSGVPSFALLQETLKTGPTDTLVYYVFDLLFLEDQDLRGIALQQRKSMLEALVGDTEGPIRFSDHQLGSGPPFFESACRMALEGVVSKQMSAPYKSGRTRDWLKSKCVERQEFVIGGFTKPTAKVRGIGALLLGYYDDGKLVYVGRVGTGFNEQTSRELREQLDGILADGPPFAALPAEAKRDAIWVAPRLVCEVEYRSWTHDGRLRHASYQGLREDRPPETVTLERSRGNGGGADEDAKQERSADRAGILENARLTHPDRVLYPQQGLTKRGLAEYYVEVADWILPHVAGRPLSLVRCPSGQGKECFYQKHISKGLPEGLREVMIKESEGEEPYSVVDGVEGLLALVQMNVLEIHPWGSRAEDVERPDRLIFDLDPDPSVGWPQVIEAGLEMRERLAAMKLTSFVKTTGGKGLHVVVPITPRQEWPEVKAFCEAVATAAARDSPDRYTTNMAKAARPGKIFLDYLRNGRGATAIAAYSPRARPGAPVATPLAWDELSPSLGSDHYTVATLPRRLKALAHDPWAEMGKIRQSIAGKQPKSAKRAK